MDGRIKKAYWNVRKGLLVEAFGSLVGGSRLGDTAFLLMDHKQRFGAFPRLSRPRRFRDRILAVMLSEGHDDVRARVTDKELVKQFIIERTGKELTAKTYAVLRSKDEVRNFRFPENCAIKATHDSGGIILRRNGSPIDLAKIDAWFTKNYYFTAREPNYRYLEPKIIVEELLSAPQSDTLADFKFFCFHGVPAFIQVDVDRFTNHRRSIYSPNWRELDFTMKRDRAPSAIRRPEGIEEMLSAAALLSAGFSFLRVDFFQLPGRIIVGELTNFPEGTRTRFVPDSADFKAGSLFDDPQQDVEVLFGTYDRAAH